ncbi:pyridoxal-phosphate dependent enzyme [Algoriphagus sp. NF]|jgi:cystathionine beta-synthase|uniref:Pyridoxal-phosphate dependent enzyme n=1 Tax=Algoriphagus marincola TaxID=264027 RepID=A0ABS7NAH5_9BACT|nr:MULTISPECIES: pyridoxal-phosphate dependent enzyme [Algoriphagus]MBY5952883.1 pyridoxal-phosphate dependent enzyme [Algoriphagus marincola]MCR9083512.1 pyridoxal-phosphate dependent enzyme [Cyclobacteriaceae bacterium]MDE0561598.1 pyridoxal-phosphate dependent enzyme [Algoriphagus sp. NF]
MIYNSIIETIGNTPMIRLNRVAKDIKGEVLVKVEYFNPGNSMKDRMAIKMVEDAEKAGILKPGGTIIEGTSGNTGMGLALAAVAKGYKCIFTMADKQSKEKIDILKAVGAEVIVCPTNVAPEDPRSYYSVARKLNADIPNSFYPNQYDNMSNTAAHYETTGPEIWKDTDGKITHYAAGVGTGGSMCGTATYLKEQNPNIVTVGIDTYGSVFKKYKETGVFDEKEVYPYLTEGIGEDILPKNVNFDVIDHFIKVTDKDAAVMTRRLAREEGLFIGWSCGAAVHGALEWARENLKEGDQMVVILPDHGTRYLGKVYNDDWMRNHGFLEDKSYATARDIISKRPSDYSLIAVKKSDAVREAIALMNKTSVSQIPVLDGGEVVGSVTDTKLLSKIIENPVLKDAHVSDVMEDSMTFVAGDSTLDVLSSMIEKEKAVLVRDGNGNIHIITKHDILEAFTN